MEKWITLLNAEIDQAKKAKSHLVHSLRKIETWDFSKEFDVEELETLEALTARFERLSDILVQKVLKTIDTIDQEKNRTVRERLISAEKKELISNHNTFLEIRELRNIIAHDYNGEKLGEIVQNVRQYSKFLIQVLSNVIKYINREYLKK